MQVRSWPILVVDYFIGLLQSCYGGPVSCPTSGNSSDRYCFLLENVGKKFLCAWLWQGSARHVDKTILAAAGGFPSHSKVFCCAQNRTCDPTLNENQTFLFCVVYVLFMFLCHGAATITVFGVSRRSFHLPDVVLCNVGVDSEQLLNFVVRTINKIYKI